MSRQRTRIFGPAVEKLAESSGGRLTLVSPVRGSEEEALMFHTRFYLDFVKSASEVGTGYLDYGDTPCFKGVYEASLYPVGSTLNGLKLILKGEFDHFFNPVGGLHHARRDRAGGFCVFNDAAVAASWLLENGTSRLAYVDIDAHHGDGVFYSFESEPRVIIGDIHEDGRGNQAEHPPGTPVGGRGVQARLRPRGGVREGVRAGVHPVPVRRGLPRGGPDYAAEVHRRGPPVRDREAT
jgi:acetoin utilization deacetylase AcuC-like enzyme